MYATKPALILQTLVYSLDGITTKVAGARETVHVQARTFEGLQKAGYVSEPPAAAASMGADEPPAVQPNSEPPSVTEAPPLPPAKPSRGKKA